MGSCKSSLFSSCSYISSEWLFEWKLTKFSVFALIVSGLFALFSINRANSWGLYWHSIEFQWKIAALHYAFSDKVVFVSLMKTELKLKIGVCSFLCFLHSLWWNHLIKHNSEGMFLSSEEAKLIILTMTMLSWKKCFPLVLYINRLTVWHSFSKQLMAAKAIGNLFCSYFYGRDYPV